MIELIVGTYGVLCWLVFKKFKLIPVNTYTIFTAILGGVVILAVLFISLSVFHPVSHDGRMYAPVVQIVPQVRGTVIEVPVEANKPLKTGDVLFRIDPKPYQIEVDRLRASLAAKNVKFAQLSEQLAAAEAATKEARANLLVAESQFDRQARETHEQATRPGRPGPEAAGPGEGQPDPAWSCSTKGRSRQQELDQTGTRVLTLQEEHRQAVAAEKVAAGEAEVRQRQPGGRPAGHRPAGGRRAADPAPAQGRERRGEPRGPGGHGPARQGPVGPRPDGGPGPDRRVRPPAAPPARG